MMRRSQSIAIKPTSRKGDNSSHNSIRFHDAAALNHQGLDHDCHHDDESYHERMYDSATWRMYHRIVDHRNSKLFRGIYAQEAAANATKTSTSTVLGGKMTTMTAGSSRNSTLRTPPGFMDLMISASYQGGLGQGPSSSSSSSSTTMPMDEDEIFELEL
jgi:hypothetical protein